MENDPRAIYPECSTGDCVLRHTQSVPSTPLCSNGQKSRDITQLSNTLLDINEAVKRNRRSLRPLSILDVPTLGIESDPEYSSEIDKLYDEYAPRYAELDSDHEETLRKIESENPGTDRDSIRRKSFLTKEQEQRRDNSIRSLDKEVAEKESRLRSSIPTVPNNFDQTGGYNLTARMPQRNPMMSRIFVKGFKEALDSATDPEDREMLQSVYESQKRENILPWGVNLRGERARKFFIRSKIRKELRRRRNIDPTSSDTKYMQDELAKINDEIEGTDWGPRISGVRDPHFLAFETERELSGNCQRGRNIGVGESLDNQDLWTVNKDRQDPQRRRHLDSVAKVLCDSCALQHKCNKYQLLAEEQGRGPTQEELRSPVRGAIKESLEQSSSAKRSNLLELLNPQKALDVASRVVKLWK